MEEYDENAPSKYAMYLDANSYYGWAVSQYLPTGNFRWMTGKETNKIDLGKYKADGKKGLILELDLEYPRELHDLHNDYPVAPEKAKVSKNMLSRYFTSPGLSWDAMLSMTNIELELMTNVDMFQFIEKKMRGRVSYIANRYWKANNK